MKNRFIFIFFCLSLYTSAQTREIKSFNFQDNNIEYTRIDYSSYGFAHFFVTMYSTDSKYNLIEQGAYNCLLRKDRIYHTLYFFIRVPSHIEDLKVKNKLFSEFINHLTHEENLKAFNLYLNFDQDYSSSYQLQQKNEDKNNVKRVISNISDKTICRALSIR